MLLVVDTVAAVAAVGGSIWTYRHGRFAFLKRSLIGQCSSLDGTISLGRASDILRRWRSGFIPYVSAGWATLLYRAVGDLAAVRNCRAIIAERIDPPEEDDEGGLGSGFGFVEPPGIGGPREVLEVGEDTGPPGFGPETKAEGKGKAKLRVRRGKRRDAARTVYNHVVAEIGLRTDSPGQREVVMDVAVKILKQLNVRLCDRPDLLAEVASLYFTPRESQLQFAAMLKNSWHTSLRSEVANVK